jgi:hypothetical protein
MSRLTDTRYPDIDYRQRPASYWGPEDDPLAAILHNVKGTNRRQMIRDYWEQGRLDELDDRLLGEDVDEDVRRQLGLIHPSFMGGEYLPDYEPLEEEIARIELQSTTSDVISIRARPTPDGDIKYRVVDEYDSGLKPPIERSRQPLDLGELVSLIDGTEGGLALVYNQMNLDGGADAEDLRCFTTLSSDFYPDLYTHYDRIHEAWLQQQLAERAERTGGRV